MELVRDASGKVVLQDTEGKAKDDGAGSAPVASAAVKKGSGFYKYTSLEDTMRYIRAHVS